VRQSLSVAVLHQIIERKNSDLWQRRGWRRVPCTPSQLIIDDLSLTLLEKDLFEDVGSVKRGERSSGQR